MRQDMNTTPQRTAQSSYVDIPVVESLSPLIISSTTPPPVVDAPVRSLTPNNQSLSFLQSGSADRPQLHVPLYPGGGAVSSLSLDQMLYHDVQAVRAWPQSACDELLAVAVCSGALDDTLPLMSVETFPRATGGIRSALDNMTRLT